MFPFSGLREGATESGQSASVTKQHKLKNVPEYDTSPTSLDMKELIPIN